MAESETTDQKTTREPVGPTEVGRRIVVWGVTGAGKTTAARAIGQALGLPVIEIDGLYWQPGWQAPDDSEFIDLVQRTLDACPEGWVCDGNYSRLIGPTSLADADTVVWLDLPFHVTFPRMVSRTVRNMLRRELLWGKCRETWGQMYWLVRFAFTQPPIMREKARTSLELLRERQQVRMYRLRSKREVAEFLAGLAPSSGPKREPQVADAERTI